jgi:ABC-type branched-subunit amino acid transport system substrate-binding protein
MPETAVGDFVGAKVAPSLALAHARRAAARREALADGADFVVGLLVPINGSAGIWGPSSIACAQLAQAEINADGGLLDRRLRLRIIDSSDEATEVGSVTAELMNAGAIDAIVGMHTSQVRQRVLKDVARQIPYVYTPLYEGGERTPGVFALGETPGQQLRPAIEYLASRYAARRWMFVGNDYVWPRVSHRLAARYVGELGGTVVADRYLPFGAEDYSELLDEIARLKPHAICSRSSARTPCSSTAHSAAAAWRATCSASRAPSRRTACSRSAPTIPRACSSRRATSPRSTTTPTSPSRSATTTTSDNARRR